MRVFLIALSLSCAAINSISLFAQGPSRVVTRRFGTPLEQLLVAGDTSVIVVDKDDGPSAILPGAGDSLMGWSCQWAQAAAIVSITGVQTQLTPNHDWISSTYTASVEQVAWKFTRGLNFSAGGHFAFERPGGAVQLNGVPVVAQSSLMKLIQIGKRYLTFVTIDSATNGVNPMGAWTYLIGEDGVLRTLSNRPLTTTPLADDVNGRQLNDILGAFPSVCPSN